MRKIRLDLEALSVDTFAVLPIARRGEGTVRAQSYTLPIPYSVCTSVSGETECNCETHTQAELGTCQHTVCDCDQAGSEFEC